MVADGIIAYIGIGSNLENPLAQCRKAINILACADGIKILQVSSFYNTEPVGMTSQDDFVNAVCEIRTRLSPRQLIGVMKNIEERMGRRSSMRWGPRIIDLDFLFYDQEVIQDEDLKIPHPECHKRRFVLEPLCEIASYMIHPAFGISVRGLLDRLDDPCRVERIL